jgi:hypothetical protein
MSPPIGSPFAPASTADDARHVAGLDLDLAAVLRAARVAARGKRRSRDVAAFLLDAERHGLAIVRELRAAPGGRAHRRASTFTSRSGA